MKALVTGGAGYIGGFMTKLLLESGYEIVVLDSLERGRKENVNSKAVFTEGNLHDEVLLENLFEKHTFDAVFHFAGYISMGESMENPKIYFKNNTFGSLVLLDMAAKHGTKNFIFSSSAGVYGNPTKIPIPEDSQKSPTNPYGESKLMFEKILEWYQNIYDISFASLRYFNAAGASLDGSMGESHHPETHLIPNAIRALLEGKDFELFGNDYNTPDGTCVRDYIHVLDLTQSHLLALEKIIRDKGGYFFNVGTGQGHSNREVLKMIEDISGKKIKIIEKKRRPGDADTLVADPAKIKKELNFSPKYSDLKTIIETALLWHSK